MNAKTLINFYNIMNSQWLTAARLREIQNRRLRKIVRHAYDNVVYYRKLFSSAGILPEDIRSVDDLYKIPITTKSRLQAFNIREIAARGTCFDKCVKVATSGENGIPFEFYLSREEYDYWKLIFLRFLMVNGMRLTDKCAVLAYPLRFPERKRWFQRLGILRHSYISAFDSVEDYTSKIIETNPDVILGYAGALKLFAQEAQRRGGINIKPRLIFSSAEMLDGETRDSIRDIFGVGVADLYSVIETGPLAWECPHREGYHINIDSVVLECLTEGGRAASWGEMGRVICTNLFNFTTPIIRYSVDDVAVLNKKACSCGRGFPLLENIAGRSVDFITLTDGRVVSPAAMTCLLRKLIPAAQYKLIQETKGRLLLQLVPGKDFRYEAIAYATGEMRRELGSDIDIDVEIVKGIENSGSGKTRPVFSRVLANISGTVR